ncbi:hypothetical protein GALMADRAFT_250096 [Galerina marginata CBS 339.88]|uniref:AB hydrolase-1 domain-containing protein n=1 Tax=Galerina marginata (strain CBS 339.88) TaxID=685588 RepID=A0A067T5K1_GALM3|nr:hypothetical protein GALMADRAFT_250096 [Galerina marginata CBS 339.88]
MSFRFLTLLLACIAFVQATTTAPFKPSEYPKSTASCKAIRRGPTEEVVDIQIKYVNINPGASKTMLMVHGWPSLWSTWSKQIQEFQEDYHLVVPDLRGFGESAHPGEMQSSGTMGDMVDDMVCVLEDAKVDSAICMGHDWGSAVCYEAARLRPDLFTAVIGIVVPYLHAAGPFAPIKDLVKLLPTLAYQVFFDSQPDAAASELNEDIRRSLRATLRTVASPPPDSFLKNPESFLAAWDGVDEIPPIPFFSPEEENYFVEQFSLGGFKHTIQFYAENNRRRNWQLANSQGNHTLLQPVLAVYPKEDPVADWDSLAKMLNSAQYLPNLTTKVLPGAHWVHLEYPQELNAVVRNWLQGITTRGDQHVGKHDDEL